MKNIYISIGCNCTPRGYIYKKFNLTKENGYKTCPFDLCITSYESLYNCLKTDFIYFFDNLTINNITNYYGIIFNHESSSHSYLFKEGCNDDYFYTRNDFYEFKKRYSERIKNFRDYIDEYDSITLVHSIHEGFNGEGDLQDICNILNEKYPNKKFSFIEVSLD